MYWNPVPPYVPYGALPGVPPGYYPQTTATGPPTFPPNGPHLGATHSAYNGLSHIQQPSPVPHAPSAQYAGQLTANYLQPPAKLWCGYIQSLFDRLPHSLAYAAASHLAGEAAARVSCKQVSAALLDGMMAPERKEEIIDRVKTYVSRLCELFLSGRHIPDVDGRLVSAQPPPHWYAQNAHGKGKGSSKKKSPSKWVVAKQERLPVVQGYKIELAVECVLRDSSLAQPTSDGRQVGMPSMVLQQPLFATMAKLPEVLHDWPVHQLHTQALKGTQSLFSEVPGLDVSAHVDFGVRELMTRQDARDWLFHQGFDFVSLCAAGTDEHADWVPTFIQQLHLQFSSNASNNKRLASNNSMQRDKVPFYIRQLTIQNAADHDLLLIDARAAPKRPGMLSLLDDFGLASTASNENAAQGESAEHDSRVCVQLRPQEQYSLTVALQSIENPQYNAAGVLQQIVLLTFAAREGSKLAMQAKAAGCTGCVVHVGDGAGYWLFVVGRRVTAAVLRRVSDLTACLNVEAKAFVPEHLKKLFDQQPMALHTALPLLTTHLFAQSYNPTPAEAAAFQPVADTGDVKWDMDTGGRAAHEQTGLHAQRWKEAQAKFVDTPGGRALCAMARLLLLEEGTMEQHIKRYDMFNVCMGFALFNPRCTHFTLLQALPGSADALINSMPSQTEPYRGPTLPSLIPEGRAAQLVANPPGEHVLVALEVPGLPEGRPTLYCGDCVYLRLVCSPQEEYMCCVVTTQTTRRPLALLAAPLLLWDTLAALKHQHAAASSTPLKVLTHVRFTFDRSSFARQHRALVDAHVATRELLPPFGTPDSELPSAADVETTAASLEMFGGTALNAEQRRAAAAVLCSSRITDASSGMTQPRRKHARNTPLALFGPPGTGKTVTLVECALQVYHKFPESRLLLAAPQNYSADLLAAALCSAGLSVQVMVRVNDPRRPPATVKQEILSYCCWHEELKTFRLPTPPQLLQYRVVVVTCGAAGLLKSGWYSSLGSALEFSHVFIDEAGQAIVPEALCALTLLSPKPGSLALLAGDPRQLGPILRSSTAISQGLNKSLLERLMDEYTNSHEAYAVKGLASPTIMLLRNYRSAARLLDLPSRMFYDGRLLAAADGTDVKAVQWQELYDAEQGPAIADVSANVSAEVDGENGESGFDESQLPVHVMFYGVMGEQLKEGEAPSYFNAIEASVLADLVEGLLRSKSGVGWKDIGVIATYRKQVQRIRLLLRARSLGSVRVGTVDDYQGQEARVIFISTVLSRPESLPPNPLTSSGLADVHMGFWRNPKRFNVAITRAKALLVVVGHPVVLMEDPSWRELLRYCASRGAYKGAGSALMSRMVRNDVGEAAHGLFGDDEQINADDYQEDSNDLPAAVAQIAEMALLGVGDVDRLFPETLDEAYQAFSDELQWRVML